MNIAIVTLDFEDLAENSNLIYVALQISACGHQTYLITRKYNSRKFKITVRNFEQNGGKILYIENHRIGATYELLNLQLSVLELLNTLELDVVISGIENAPLSLYANLNSKSVKVVSYIDKYIYTNKILNWSDFSSIYEINMTELQNSQIKNSNLIVCKSNFEKSLIESLGITDSKIIVISSLVGPSLMNNKSNTLTNESEIIYIVVFLDSYNYDFFAKLLENLFRHSPKSKIHTYSNFNESQIKALKNKSKFNSNFVSYNFGNIKDLIDEYIDMDVTLIYVDEFEDGRCFFDEFLVLNCLVFILTSRKYMWNKFSNFENIIISDIYDIEEIIGKPRPDNKLARKQIEEHNKEILDAWLHELSYFDRPKRVVEKNTDLMTAEAQITVIIASRDREKYLTNTLNSLVSQSKKPFEVIIIDDASKDSAGLLRVTKEFENSLEIRTVRNEISQGQARCRNFGAKIAQTKYLAFVDDDNVLLENHLHECISEIHKSDLIAVTTFMELVRSEKPLSKNAKAQSIILNTGPILMPLGLTFNTISDTHLLIERDKFLEVGGFPDLIRSSQEDWGLGIKLSNSKLKFGSTGVPTIKYRGNLDGVWANGKGLRKWWPTHGNDFWTHREMMRVLIQERNLLNKSKLSKAKKYVFLALKLCKQGDFESVLIYLKKVIKEFYWQYYKFRK